jgi:hypothetical protein
MHDSLGLQGMASITTTLVESRQTSDRLTWDPYACNEGDFVTLHIYGVIARMVGVEITHSVVQGVAISRESATGCTLCK